MKRIMTITVEIETLAEADWLWDCYFRNKKTHGLLVTAMAQGDLICEPQSCEKCKELNIEKD